MRFNMKKIILFLSILLTGCSTHISNPAPNKIQITENPYNNLTAEELSNISDVELCNSFNNIFYKTNETVIRELISRGYKNCSYGELSRVENPYVKVSPKMLSKISSYELCATIKNPSYKTSENVLKELVHRNYKDCTSSEVYCRETLELKPGTKEFADCRMRRDEYELDAYYKKMNLFR